MADLTNYIKPDIDSEKILTKTEQETVKTALAGRIFKSLIPAKNDYVDSNNKGSVYFTTEKRVDGTPEHRNYMNYKTIVPDGITVKNCVFHQHAPDTEAIIGKNLHFVDCSMRNVKIDPTWTFENCHGVDVHLKYIHKETKDVLINNTLHKYRGKLIVDEPAKAVTIEIHKKIDGKFVKIDEITEEIKPEKLQEKLDSLTKET